MMSVKFENNKEPGRRAHLIANKNSGQGRGSKLAEEAKAICDELGYELVPYTINSPEDFERQSKKAVDEAEKDGGVVIAAGGDGTIRGVAQAAHGRKVRFAAVPCGTFNFFARTHRIPEDYLAAFRLALTGHARPVRLGEVNGHVFLINASLGLYAKAIREREQRTSRYGRNRIVVIISTILSLLSRHLLLKVDLVTEGKAQSLYTPMIFIGNNTLQLRDLAMSVGQCMKYNLLAVVLLKPITKIEALRIVARGLFKTLENDKKVDTFCVEQMTVFTRKAAHTIALDGEMFRVDSPLRVTSLPEALNLVLPPPEAVP
jgi:diacylglycerol kinase family enzyme